LPFPASQGILVEENQVAVASRKIQVLLAILQETILHSCRLHHPQR